MCDYRPVAKTRDVPEGETYVVEVGNKEILLCHVEGEGIYAIDNICTHDYGALDAGELDGYCVECPRHGAKFDVRTGEVKALPAVVPVKSYPVRVEGEQVLIEI